MKKPSDDLVAGWDGRTRNYYQECVVKSNWWLEVARRLRCACCLVEGTCRNRRLEGASCLCYLIERGTSKLGPGRIKHVILAFYPSNRVSIIKSAGHRMTQNPPDISCRNIFFFLLSGHHWLRWRMPADLRNLVMPIRSPTSPLFFTPDRSLGRSSQRGYPAPIHRSLDATDANAGPWRGGTRAKR